MRTLATIACLFALAALGGCSKDAGGGSAEEETSADEESAAGENGEERATAQEPPEGAWPSGVLEGFLNQCKRSGMGEEFCQCSVEALQSRIPWSEMEPHKDLFVKTDAEEISAREAAAQLPEELTRNFAAAMQGCQKPPEGAEDED